MVKQIVALLPRHRIYCEPFGGAASILLNKPKSEIEVYNDLDGNLVNLFMVVRDDPQKFLERFDLLPYSRELNSRWTTDFLSGKWSKDRVERAVRYYYVLRSSFCAYLGHGWAFGRSEKRPIRTLYASLKNIREIARRLQHVYIDHDDFRDCIRNWDSAETVFYCDPPYWGSEHYYKGAPECFSEQDHLDLHEVLTRKVKGKWLLTEADHPRVRELYADCFMIKKRTMLASGPQTRTQKKKRGNALRHLIIANYDVRKLWRKNQRKKKK